MATKVAFKDVSYTKGGVRVEIEYIGEGFSGDYDPENPEDKPLLRFNVMHRVGREWDQDSDGSFCTQVPATISQEEAKRLARHIWQKAQKPKESLKRTCERLSWITDAEIKSRSSKKDWTMKKTKVMSRDGKLEGVLTGNERSCPMVGCRGTRLGVRWSDGSVTYPCTRGMIGRKYGWKIL